MQRELHEYMLNEMIERAGATDEQRAQVLAIMRGAHEDVEALRDELIVELPIDGRAPIRT